jgi:hypothetical protein
MTDMILILFSNRYLEQPDTYSFFEHVSRTTGYVFFFRTSIQNIWIRILFSNRYPGQLDTHSFQTSIQNLDTDTKVDAELKFSRNFNPRRVSNQQRVRVIPVSGDLPYCYVLGPFYRSTTITPLAKV